MKFGNFNAIHLLWIFFLVVVFYIVMASYRKKVMKRFAAENLLKELTRGINLRKYYVSMMLLLSGLFFVMFSFTRPQWGFHLEEIKKRGIEILVAVDTSNSMLAEDVKPNRLKRSKLAIKDLLKKLKSDRIGLIAFAGTAFVQCPLTVDYNGFTLALDDLDADVIPRPGTSITSAIKEAIRSYKDVNNDSKILILITDGEDNEGDSLKCAQEAKKEGINIFCIGIGTTDGELIPIVDEAGQKSFLKDKNGNVVKTRLDENILKKIANATNGMYIRASNVDFGLDYIYDKRLAGLQKKEFESSVKKRYHERYQIFLAVGFLILLLEPIITFSMRYKKDE